jgi:hypothetical protein
MHAKKLDSNLLLEKKIPLPITLGLLLVFAVIAFFTSKLSQSQKVLTSTDTVAQNCDDNVQIIRSKEFDFIHPILLVQAAEESKMLEPIKKELQISVNQFQAKGVQDFSVFLLKQNSGDWIGVNSKKEYLSRGYFRLAILITYLKQAELNPDILEKKIWYDPAVTTDSYKIHSELPTKNFYSVKDLLKIMIVNSDTTARYLLAENIDKSELNKLFKVIGLKEPDYKGRNFNVTVADYSKFLQILYNANYLNKDNSEFALSLLNDDSSKKNGLLKFLPPNSKAIHKYNERFRNGEYELRESGIIYLNKESYLLTIFATGKNNNQLDSAAGIVGKKVFDYISGN